MLKALFVSACAVALSGCVIIATDGEERTVVETAAANPACCEGLYWTAVGDPRRPADEVARDPLRKPYDMLAFIGLEPGDRIADIRPEEGYFTRLFAPVVGETGRVYAFVPTRTVEREVPLAEKLAAEYPNVRPLSGALDAMSFPEPLDVVLTAQEYHDFHMATFNTDVGRMNAAVFQALKPGGLYVIIDHQGAAATGNTQVQSLHRIEGDFLRREVEAAGFQFVEETRVLVNPEDDLSLNVFDPKIRGRTTQFVYKFRKPA